MRVLSLIKRILLKAKFFVGGHEKLAAYAVFIISILAQVFFYPQGSIRPLEM